MPHPHVRSSLCSAALAGLLALASARSAHATTVVPTTIEQLSQRSDVVVVGEVRAAHSQWVSGRIVTDYRVLVRVAARGPSSVAAGAELTVRLPGGVVGRVGQQIPGVPELATGQSYALFLQHAPTADGALLYLTHLTASVLALAAAPDGTVMVLPASEGMHVQPVTGAVAPAPSPVASTHTHGPAALAAPLPPTAMPALGMALEPFAHLVRTSAGVAR